MVVGEERNRGGRKRFPIQRCEQEEIVFWVIFPILNMEDEGEFIFGSEGIRRAFYPADLKGNKNQRELIFCLRTSLLLPCRSHPPTDLVILRRSGGKKYLKRGQLKAFSRSMATWGHPGTNSSVMIKFARLFFFGTFSVPDDP